METKESLTFVGHLSSRSEIRPSCQRGCGKKGREEKRGKGRQANCLRIISIGSILSNRNPTRSTTSRGEYYAKAEKAAHAEPMQPIASDLQHLLHPKPPRLSTALQLTLPPVPHAQPKPQLTRSFCLCLSLEIRGSLMHGGSLITMPMHQCWEGVRELIIQYYFIPHWILDLLHRIT